MKPENFLIPLVWPFKWNLFNRQCYYVKVFEFSQHVIRNASRILFSATLRCKQTQHQTDNFFKNFWKGGKRNKAYFADRKELSANETSEVDWKTVICLRCALEGRRRNSRRDFTQIKCSHLMSLRTPREQNNDLLYFYSCTLTNYLSLYSIYSFIFFYFLIILKFYR